MRPGEIRRDRQMRVTNYSWNGVDGRTVINAILIKRDVYGNEVVALTGEPDQEGKKARDRHKLDRFGFVFFAQKGFGNFNGFDKAGGAGGVGISVKREFLFVLLGWDDGGSAFGVLVGGRDQEAPTQGAGGDGNSVMSDTSEINVKGAMSRGRNKAGIFEIGEARLDGFDGVFGRDRELEIHSS